jgi:hypothetical protein
MILKHRNVVKDSITTTVKTISERPLNGEKPTKNNGTELNEPETQSEEELNLNFWNWNGNAVQDVIRNIGN